MIGLKLVIQGAACIILAGLLGIMISMPGVVTTPYAYMLVGFLTVVGFIGTMIGVFRKD